MKVRYLFVGLGVLFIGVLILNNVLTQELERQVASGQNQLTFLGSINAKKNIFLKKLRRVQEAEESRPRPKSQTPDDPKKFGIIVRTERELPYQQNQWNMVMKKIDSNAPEATHQKLEESFTKMNLSQQDYRQKITQLNNQIKALEAEKIESPNDQSVLSKLQNLYMMRSLYTTFKDKMIKRSDQQPQQTQQTQLAPSEKQPAGDAQSTQN